ncbi:bifunctional oligoribonuclease/PAP phosphatase NrnA [Dialister hominis]|jgi:phosphoesterase RecJ-like protein|uniref:Phosphoesterase n=2 Tax=Dialister hominis TaxID=2582419 RepID=A0A8D4UTH7_9FIRM|nr:bifunctional oligoribonuclease/PAP phosphatase NrnA [Dialister hominis]BBK24363.1 phosphoesterase [Dialister hominis]
MSLGKDHAVEIDKQQAMDFLKSHNRFLLVGHEHPDGDDVGSICALHNVLLSMGKEADMVLPDPVPRVYTLVETSAQVMTSIPEGKDYDAIVFTDLSNLERGGNFDFPDVDSLCIDHHRSNERYTDYLYLRYHYAATAEMLAEMFFDEGIQMDKDTCNALYMAIGTDSGFFKFSCTSPHTLLMASKLVEMGADPSYISNRLEEKTEEAMKCYKIVAGTVHSYANGKIVIAYMDKEAMDLDGENSDYYATIPRCIKGCEIAALFKYRGEKETRISLRAKEYANVGKLAEEFGGGGHWKASGCTIHETFADAEPIFVKAAEKYL